MLKKPCPWCNKMISNWNVGNRPRTTKPKWYGITRNLQVCPYCCNGVKLGGKAMYGLLAFLPVFLLLPLELVIGTEIIDTTRFRWLFFAMAAGGFLITMLFSFFEKDHDL